jgi:outer membrane protein OmpA-like peptidoglycan-associated protein
MKTTRPVFESFGAFVDFLKSDSLNEATTPSMGWKEILSNLAGFLDDGAKKAFNSAKLAYNKAPMYQSSKFKKASTAKLGQVLGELDSKINNALDNNNKAEGMQMSETTSTEVKTFTYSTLINGKVKVADVPAFATYASSGCVPGDYFDNGKWVDLNDLITALNFENLTYSDSDPNAEDTKKNDKWFPIKSEDDYVSYSGAFQQNLISSVAAGFVVNDNNIGTPKNSAKVIPALAFANKDASKITDNPTKVTTILYGIGNITQAAGEEIPDTLIKKEMTTEVVPGTVKEYETSITGDDKMFDQGKINIKNKAGIDKAISAALSPLAGAPESIVITGGASFEGGLELNKKLVVERAKAVQVYMEGLYPALKGKITVAETDFSKIQTKDVPAEYEQYRKVYLKIKGVLQGDSYTIDKEITYSVDAPINADTVEIIQYAITREFTLPNFKSKKK